MKHISTIIGVFACLIFFTSCDDNIAESHAQQKSEKHSAQPVLAVNDGLEYLSLDNGQKWKMDEHTRTAFSEMAAFFLNSNYMSMDAKELEKIGIALKERVDVLIGGCTMSGQAHDQLHIYLMEYIPVVDALLTSGKAEDAKKVRYYLEQYIEYFE